MKHWLWYKKNGAFGGCELKEGGWGEEHNFLSEDKHPIIQGIFDIRNEHPDFEDYFLYECSCLSSKKACRCPHNACIFKCLRNGKIVDKGPLDVYLEDVLEKNTTKRPTVIKTANSTLSLILKGPLPDGSKVIISQPNNSIAIVKENPTLVVFNNGESNKIELQVPPKGFKSMIVFNPEDDSLASPRSFILQGW